MRKRDNREGGMTDPLISLIWVVCKEVRKRDNRVGGVNFGNFCVISFMNSQFMLFSLNQLILEYIYMK